ncbi:MAG TPA: SURF1 family protein [Halomonas sp.]|nr:SURF1 family protein [Halomonas sp.]
MAVSRRRAYRWVWWGFWAGLAALGIYLGLWQWERAEDKRLWQAAYENAPSLIEPSEAPPFGARLTLTGEYLGEQTLFLDNRIHAGRLGVAVLTPLRGRDGRLWLVERGFLATGTARGDPHVAAPTGTVIVRGRWQPAGDQGLLLGVNREGKRLQQIDLDAFAGSFAHAGWLHLQQASEQGLGQAPGESPDRLASWWQPSVMSPARHLAYALQWWGLALAALVFMWVGRRRRAAAPANQRKGETDDAKRPR